MARPFNEYHKFDLFLVFKVIMIIESFTFRTFESGSNCHFGFGIFFNMSEGTSVEELPNIHQPDQIDLCQGHSSN